MEAQFFVRTLVLRLCLKAGWTSLLILRSFKSYHDILPGFSRAQSLVCFQTPVRKLMPSYALFLGSDSKYTTIMQNFVSHVAQDGPKLRMYPNWLRSWVSALVLTTPHSESCVQFCQLLSIRQKRKGTRNWELFVSDHRKACRKGYGSGELWSGIGESMRSQDILIAYR